MRETIFKIDKNYASVLAGLRCIDGLLVAADDAFIWVKVNAETALGDPRLRTLPVADTYGADENGRLFPVNGVTPVASLPQLEWQPLRTFIKPELPVSALPGRIQDALSIHIVPSDKNEKESALLIGLSLWKQYADTASSVRLKTLRFAVSEKQEVLVIGSPLPPLPGKELWLSHDILLPCGYDFETEITHILVQKKLNAEGDSLIFFDETGSWQRISKTFFVSASRSAVRLTGNAEGGRRE